VLPEDRKVGIKKHASEDCTQCEAGNDLHEGPHQVLLSLASVLAVAAADGVEELLRVEGDAVFEDEGGVFDVVDVVAGVAGDDDEVGVFAHGDGADVVGAVFEGGAVEGADFDGFDGREAGGDEELDLTLVAVAGEGAAVAGGVGAGEEEAAGFDEGVLHGHVVVEHLDVKGGGFGI